MKSYVVDCAGCGAPLSGNVSNTAGALVPCLYCGALLRFSAPTAAPTVAQYVPAAMIAQIREAAIRGGRAEAITLCTSQAQVTTAAAEAAVDDVIKALANRSVFTQALNGVGWVLVLSSIAFILAGLWLLGSESPLRWWGLLPLFLGTLHLVLLGRGIVTSVRVLLAQRGAGYIVHSVHVGPTGFSDGSQVYSLALDITPERGGASFHARLVLPVRSTSLEKVAAGKTLPVRYERGSDWVRSDSR